MDMNIYRLIQKDWFDRIVETEEGIFENILNVELRKNRSYYACALGSTIYAVYSIYESSSKDGIFNGHISNMDKFMEDELTEDISISLSEFTGSILYINNIIFTSHASDEIKPIVLKCILNNVKSQCTYHDSYIPREINADIIAISKTTIINMGILESIIDTILGFGFRDDVYYVDRGKSTLFKITIDGHLLYNEDSDMIENYYILRQNKFKKEKDGESN